MVTLQELHYFKIACAGEEVVWKIAATVPDIGWPDRAFEPHLLCFLTVAQVYHTSVRGTNFQFVMCMAPAQHHVHIYLVIAAEMHMQTIPVTAAKLSRCWRV